MEATMVRRKITNETEAQTYLAIAAASGLPHAEWARSHGIDPRSLHAWYLNLNRRGGTKSAPTPHFLELVPAPPPATAVRPAVSKSPAVIRVHRGDITVELGDGADEAQIVRVVRALTSC